MIEKRLVQWYAADAGVDLDIAEREIVLAYVLRILSDEGLLDQLAFKGGTAIRKLCLGGIGRFSLDLDFTALGETTPDNFVLDLVGALHERTHHGLTFTIPSPDYYATDDSCGAEVAHHHDWVTAGRFGVSQLSCSSSAAGQACAAAPRALFRLDGGTAARCTGPRFARGNRRKDPGSRAT
jgi:hypothetical protein